MLAFFRALVARLKALLLTDATLDLQAQVATKAAERKADLLRRAAAYEKEGLTTVAADLREQAEALDLSQPLAIVVPVFESFAAGSSAAPALPGPVHENTSTNGGQVQLPKSAPVPSGNRQRGRKGS